MQACNARYTKYGDKFLSKPTIEQVYIDVSLDSYQTLIGEEFRSNLIPQLYKHLTASGKSAIGDSMAHIDRMIMNNPRLTDISEYQLTTTSMIGRSFLQKSGIWMRFMQFHNQSISLFRANVFCFPK